MSCAVVVGPLLGNFLDFKLKKRNFKLQRTQSSQSYVSGDISLRSLRPL